jgi:hypothetical protein
MTFLLKSLRRIYNPIHPIAAGIYHYQAPQDDLRNYRLHLRVEPDGNGILIVNAATVLHMNQTATEYAYYLIHSLSPDQAAKKMSQRYHVSSEQARQDYQDLVGRIQTLVETPDLDPVTFLDFERQTPFTGYISAPYRLDCAITYRLPEGSAAEAAPTERVKQELSTAEWQTILDKAWNVGIPHVVFTGGEPTLRDDLPELIARAETNSQVTGLLTDGLRLADADYLEKLLQTGLDHLMLILNFANEGDWQATAQSQALQNALSADIFVAVHLSLTAENAPAIPSFLKRLADLGVKAASLSAADASLTGALQAARDQIADLGLELIWNLPTPYSNLHPVALETSQMTGQPEGAGRAWLYVEPDGDVLPTQGVNKVLGNFLNDDWEKIWKKEN